MNKKILFALLVLFPGLACAASFNCDEAARPLDKAICAHEQLSALDEQMADYYFKLKETMDDEAAAKLLAEQRDWLKQRSRHCSSCGATCLIELYKARILALRIQYENLVPYTAVRASDLQGIKYTCGFGRGFAADLAIFAGGAYSGKKLDRQIDESGHRATQFEVIVNTPDKPVALILGAYEPSVWNIAWTRGTQIEAVVATGYYRQAVAGIPDETPVLISTHDNQGPCGYLYVAEKNLQKINPLSNRVFGKNVDLVHYAGEGTLLFGNPITKEDKLFTSRETPPEMFFDASLPLAGEAGLTDLAARGLIRAVRPEDLERWARRKAENQEEQLPPVASGDNWTAFTPRHIHNGYVILEHITIPAGLYGGNSATFFLEKGVPHPKGKLGHCTLYDFNTMSCSGPGCPRD